MKENEPHEGHPDDLVIWVECERCGEPLVEDRCLNCDPPEKLTK